MGTELSACERVLWLYITRRQGHFPSLLWFQTLLSQGLLSQQPDKVNILVLLCRGETLEAQRQNNLL